MTTIESQIIDLQNKMNQLQRKQKEVEQRKKNTIDVLFVDYSRRELERIIISNSGK